MDLLQSLVHSRNKILGLKGTTMNNSILFKLIAASVVTKFNFQSNSKFGSFNVELSNTRLFECTVRYGGIAATFNSPRLTRLSQVEAVVTALYLQLECGHEDIMQELEQLFGKYNYYYWLKNLKEMLQQKTPHKILGFTTGIKSDNAILFAQSDMYDLDRIYITPLMKAKAEAL